MKRPNPEEFRDDNYADLFYWENYARAMDVYADYMQRQNKELIEALKELTSYNDAKTLFSIQSRVRKLLKQIES